MNRERLLWHRYIAQGLDRADDGLAVLSLGVQDTPPGSGLAALAARAKDPAALAAAATVAWTHRGAPHLHLPGDLPPLAAALWPHSAADAAARVGNVSIQLDAAGVDAREAVAETARVMREEAAEPRTKGELSAAVTARVPESYSRWCEGCGATHVYEQLFRLAALPAGLAIVPGRTLRFTHFDGWAEIPTGPSGTGELVTRFVGLVGPVTTASIAAFLGTAPPRAAELLPEGLTRIEADGHRTWSTPEVDALLVKAERPESVRLLPRSDPFMLGDRGLLMPDKAQRAELFKNLTRRGALLVGAEVAGYWQMKVAGKRLDVTVTPFSAVDKATRRRVESEAGLLAAARGLADVRVTL